MRLATLLRLAVPFSLLLSLRAQNSPPAIPSPLDAARHLSPVRQSSLLEQYIWTAGDVTALRPDHSHYPWSAKQKRIEPHFFRGTFQLSTLPPQATLYLAGPRDAEVFLNGQLLGHFASNIDAPIGFRVFHADATSLLKIGTNSIAIEAVRGRGIVAADAAEATQQLAYGEVLVVKLLAAPPNTEGPVLAISDKSWRSGTASISDDETTPQWAQPSFNDGAWNFVSSLGPVESDRDFFQWSADAGMYAWPGYQGVSSSLGTYDVLPVDVTHRFTAGSTFQHAEALTSAKPEEPFAIIWRGDTPPTDADAPSIVLDFGREIAGRLLVDSASDTDAVLSIAYGEDELEALATGLTPDQRGGNYLGTNLLEVPAHRTARGPKSAFRYVRIRFLRGMPRMAFRSIRAEGIGYPVPYAGSFESSDALLNRIWETGAYTVHLCMQDDLWDAPKRDRGRWAGDIDVEGRVISTVFGDKALLEQTLSALASSNEQPVNGIPGYSALWITSLASLYDHSGDLDFLRSEHDATPACPRHYGRLARSLEAPSRIANTSGSSSIGRRIYMDTLRRPSWVPACSICAATGRQPVCSILSATALTPGRRAPPPRVSSRVSLLRSPATVSGRSTHSGRSSACPVQSPSGPTSSRM